MRILIASSNAGKLREFRQLLSDHEVLGYTERFDSFEIEEVGKSFKENAIIKAQAIYQKCTQEERKEWVILSDDSGISLPLLGGAPGIYSARYAGLACDARANVEKLTQEIALRGLKTAPAYYTAAIALILDDTLYTTHGWMHGEAITEPRGEKGFGYDPIFIPSGETRTLAQMSEEEKNALSHRTQALALASLLLRVVSKRPGRQP